MYLLSHSKSPNEKNQLYLVGVLYLYKNYLHICRHARKREIYNAFL